MNTDRTQGVWQDVRFGFRMLFRSPGFAAVAVLTIALGVGVNVGIFSLVKTVLLDPLPYAHADRLVLIGEPSTDDPGNPVVPYTLMRDIASRCRSLESISGYGDGPAVLIENGRPEMLRGLSVDANFFDTAGVRMEMGRSFQASDQKPDQRLALILSHSLWTRRFGGDPHIVGRVLHLDTGPVEVVGVLPASFEPLLKAQSTSIPELYYPQPVDPLATCTDCQRMRFLGRLRRGVTLRQATAELNGIFAAMVSASPDSYPAGARLSLDQLPERLLGHARTALWVTCCAAGFVLLIACANVANLLLARAAFRTREIAIRMALGAGRGRLIRQLLCETMVLASAGGGLGIVLGFLCIRVLRVLAPAGIPRAGSAHLDFAGLGVALVATILAGLVFGMAPAWRASRLDLTSGIKGIRRGGRPWNRLTNVFLMTEVALAFVLAVGAGLMIRTFSQLMTVGAGFDPSHVLTLTTSVGRPAAQRIGYYREVLGRLRATPGIEGAAFTSLIPMDYAEQRQLFVAEKPVVDEDLAPRADRISVSTGYFSVMRIPLRLGRLLTGQDTAGGPRVALINESCARAEFRGENPIGKHVRLGDSPWMTVVGVVGDVHQDGIDRPPDFQIYMALNQEAIISYYRLMARTSGDPLRMERAIRGVFDAVDFSSPVYHVKRLEDYYWERLANRTFALALLGLLGTLAVVLAAVGIYGVLSYSLALRTKEFGIRVALGAGNGDVLKAVLRQVAPAVGAGLGIGATTAFLLARMLRTLLFQVAPADPITSLAVAMLLGGIATCAAVLPARRAARANPLAAIRSE